MREERNTERILKEHLEGLAAPQDAERDTRLLGAALAAMARVSPPVPPSTGRVGWPLFGRRTPVLAAAGALLALVAVLLVSRPSRSVWAIELAIEALRPYKACHFTLTLPEGTVFDCWAEAEPSGEVSGSITMRGSNGAVIWVRGDRTYYYDAQDNRVEVDDAKTAGFSPWLGAEWFQVMAIAQDIRTLFATDPATGRQRVIMTGSMTTTIGPISWSVEFDQETKLPIAYTQWDNLRRSGPPSSSITAITYYEDLPDSTFAVEVPPGVAFTQKAIVLPEANLDLLARLTRPDDGLRVAGMPRAEAARRILERVYQASMAGDLESVRRLCPLTRTWSDEMMKAFIVPDEEAKRLAEVVSIGPIGREGDNRLGPFVVLPVRLKTRAGKVWEEKQIVQFQTIGGEESCVVCGPYGMPVEVR